MNKINIRLLKKLKKSPCTKDKQLLILTNLLENNIGQIKDNEVPTRVDHVGKREIDRSTLYSFVGPFQLPHTDVANLEFLGNLLARLITLS